jgi:hypothetical protein
MALFNCLNIIILFLLFALRLRRPSLLLEQLTLELSSSSSSDAREEEDDDDDDDESFVFFFFMRFSFLFILSGDKNSPTYVKCRANTSFHEEEQPHTTTRANKDVRDDFDDVERKNIF